MIEADYTRAIHQRLPATISPWKIRDDYQGGVPDAFYLRNDGERGTSLWVEYKFIKSLPKKAGTLILPDLSPLQRQWLRRAEDAGEQVRVIVGTPGVPAAQGVMLTLDEAVTGITTAEFCGRLQPYAAIVGRIADLVMAHA